MRLIILITAVTQPQTLLCLIAINKYIYLHSYEVVHVLLQVLNNVLLEDVENAKRHQLPEKEHRKLNLDLNQNYLYSLPVIW